MKFFRTISIFVLVAGLLLAFSVPVAAGQQELQDKNNSTAARILVQFKAGVDNAAKNTVHSKNGGRVISENSDLDIQVVQVDTGKVQEKLNAYRNNPDVQFAEPDYIAAATLEPTDPLFSQEWALPNIDAPQAWDITTGAANIKIAVLDTGIDQDNEDLIGQVVANVNYSASPTVDDLFGHGTHVAGIIAAVDNGIGVVGISYDCSLMNVKVLDDNGCGYYSDIAAGITWAADNGANVINMSLGGTSASRTLSNAISYAWRKGVVIVAAAGNDNNSTPFYPAYYKNCIAVAATGQDNAKAYFSNYGKWVDVAAPGIAIVSTLPNGGCQVSSQLNHGILSGTSMASPFVAGLAGLIWTTPSGTSNQNVRSIIENSADNIAGTNIYWVYGKVNAFHAVTVANQTATNNTNTGNAKGHK